MKNIIETRALSKKYGSFEAVKGINKTLGRVIFSKRDTI